MHLHRSFKIIGPLLSLGAVSSAPTHSVNTSCITVSAAPPEAAGVPLDAFVSYSLEFYFFPDYAGNTSSPNTFSNNLLNNLGNLTGTKPYLRVGGNTQDYVTFDPTLETATIGIYNSAISTDYPLEVIIGPGFYESFQTLPGTKYIYGFNAASNDTAGRQSLLATAEYSCKALEGGKLAYWEYGNEPDLFTTSAQGAVRPPNWNEQDYVNEWLNATRAIRPVIAQTCPSLAANESYQYYAPSFAGTNNHLDPIITWEDGLDADKDISVISSHNYIGGATQPGVTLQGTLMNHTSTVASVAKQVNESRLLSALPSDLKPSNLPFILGETNSLYNEGAPGLSNSFGAALWGVDFALYCAANNISRIHWHQGTNYRYQSWQPVDTNDTAKGTKAPYYGNIAVAAFVGNITDQVPKIVDLPLQNEREAAYASYVRDSLAKVLVVNLQEYNSTEQNYTDDYPRPVYQYDLQLPRQCAGTAALQRLSADGSDAISGITFDGYSYNYELDDGLPVLLSNITRGETVRVDPHGRASVKLPASSAVIVNLNCTGTAYA